MSENLIIHLAQQEAWESALKVGIYQGDTLESAGFIYCATPEQVLALPRDYFPNHPNTLMLCIHPDQVQAEIRYEQEESGEVYPHIYGPLNLDAVCQVALMTPPGASQAETAQRAYALRPPGPRKSERPSQKAYPLRKADKLSGADDLKKGGG